MNDKYIGYIKGIYSIVDQIVYKHFGKEVSCPLTFCKGSGVYIIIRIEINKLKSDIFYIGSSKNVRKRLDKKHILDDNTKDEDYMNVIYLRRYISCDNYIEVEKKLIKIFQPTLNIQHKKWH